MLCEHCSIEAYQKNSAGKRSLTPADVKMLADQADEMGLARFVISGGEPTTFPDLDELVAAIGPDRFFINSDSNGYLLAQKAAHMKEIGIEMHESPVPVNGDMNIALYSDNMQLITLFHAHMRHLEEKNSPMYDEDMYKAEIEDTLQIFNVPISDYI